ncbi:MAG: hypothetical protein HY690_05225 [Chloroflexi bacterium]|nr:hypothetical protein [Chloroflexota bacterium]
MTDPRAPRGHVEVRFDPWGIPACVRCVRRCDHVRAAEHRKGQDDELRERREDVLSELRREPSWAHIGRIFRTSETEDDLPAEWQDLPA